MGNVYHISLQNRSYILFKSNLKICIQHHLYRYILCSSSKFYKAYYLEESLEHCVNYSEVKIWVFGDENKYLNKILGVSSYVLMRFFLFTMRVNIGNWKYCYHLKILPCCFSPLRFMTLQSGGWNMMNLIASLLWLTSLLKSGFLLSQRIS